MCVATECEPTTDAAAEAVAQADTLILADQQICPQCESPIPKECVEGTPTDGVRGFKVVRTVTIYCPRCGVGRQAEFTIRDGRPVQVSHSRLVMGESVRHLRDRLAAVRGEIRWDAAEGLVERVGAGMRQAADEADRADKHSLAHLISRTREFLMELEAHFDERFADTPAVSLGGIPTPRRAPPAPERTIDTSTSQIPNMGGGDDGPTEEDPERFDGLS